MRKKESTEKGHLVSIAAGDGQFDKLFLAAGFSIALAQERKASDRAQYKKTCPGVYVYAGTSNLLTEAVMKNYAGESLLGLICRDSGKSPDTLAGRLSEACKLKPRFLCIGYKGRENAAKTAMVKLGYTPFCFNRLAVGFPASEKAALKLFAGLSPDCDRETVLTFLYTCMQGETSGAKAPDAGMKPVQARKKETGKKEIAAKPERASAAKPAQGHKEKAGKEKPVQQISASPKEKRPAALPEAPAADAPEGLPASYKGHAFTKKELSLLQAGLSVQVSSKQFTGEVVLLKQPGKKDRLYAMPDTGRDRTVLKK